MYQFSLRHVCVRYVFVVLCFVFYLFFVASLQIGFNISPLFSSFAGEVMIAIFSTGIILRHAGEGNMFFSGEPLEKHKLCKMLSLFLIILLLVLMSYFPQFIQDDGLHMRSSAINGDITGYAVFSCLFAPLFEEIFYRLFIYNYLRLDGSRIIPMIFSSLLFGISHGTVTHALFGMFFGILMCMIYDVSGSPWFIVLYHMLYNILSLFIGYILPDSCNIIAYVSMLIMMAVSFAVIWLFSDRTSNRIRDPYTI